MFQPWIKLFTLESLIIQQISCVDFKGSNLAPGLDWPLCHRATEQWLTIVLRYDGTMASPSLPRIPSTSTLHLPCRLMRLLK